MHESSQSSESLNAEEKALCLIHAWHSSESYTAAKLSCSDPPPPVLPPWPRTLCCPLLLCLRPVSPSCLGLTCGNWTQPGQASRPHHTCAEVTPAAGRWR